MAATETRPTKELVQELARETSTLVRQELALAKVELGEKGRRAGVGGGLLGAAGLLSVLALGALVACAILALATAVTDWVAALIVAGVLLAAAGVAAQIGRRQMRSATPPAPEQALHSFQEDIQTVKEHVRR